MCVCVFYPPIMKTNDTIYGRNLHLDTYDDDAMLFYVFFYFNAYQRMYPYRVLLLNNFFSICYVFHCVYAYIVVNNFMCYTYIHKNILRSIYYNMFGNKIINNVLIKIMKCL